MEKYNKDEVIGTVERDLKLYDKIFLFDTADKKVFACMSYFCNSGQMRETPKKVLVMGVGNISRAAKDCYRPVTKQQFEDLLDIYDMYEFSNKFQYIGRQVQYGSLFNYVKTGLLTVGEMFEAMLA